jgi:uncharacterized hydrophobic protein (TIGR00271 family)
MAHEHTGAEAATLRVDRRDLERMRDQLLFDGPEAARKLSRFWTLLTLAAIIASAGIVSDSTATVIGAMIVAPLMTPILGTVLSIVTGDTTNLARSVGLVVAGAALVVVTGYAIGLLVPFDVVSSTSSQVAGRIHPRLIDLVAALATGAVGSFALVRSDISDTLPGVAIAISLVPPLAVAGITLESGAPDESAGALLLFLTNVAAILLSGLVVMALYRVRQADHASSRPRRGRLSTAVVLGFVILIAIPLGVTSRTIATERRDAARIQTVATAWAEPASWRIDAVEPSKGAFIVRTAGPLPAPTAKKLRRQLDDAGLGDVAVKLLLTPEYTFELTARGTPDHQAAP